MPNIDAMIAEDRDLIRRRGDRLNQDAEDRARYYRTRGLGYQEFGDEIADSLMRGEGGYSPDEAGEIRQREEWERGRTSGEDYDRNFYTPEEQQQISGNPWNRAAWFDSDSMTDRNRESAGRQRAAAGEVETGMRRGITDDLNLSEGYSSGVDQVLGTMEGGVRGAIDPTRLRADQGALDRIRMGDDEYQDIITNAGINAGTGYRAAIGDIERSSRAAGQNPMGLATMRRRFEREAAGAAGDAETNARVAAGSERARRAGVAEDLRRSGETAYTDRAVDAEFGLGRTRLDANTTREGMRLDSARDRSNREMDAARVGGLTRLGAERDINAQERQQEQFNAVMGTEIATGIERDEVDRAREIAQNRQEQQRRNQLQRFDQSGAIATAGSVAGRTVADARRQSNAEGRDWVYRQSDNTQNREQQEYNRQQQNYGQQGGMQMGATGNAIQQNAAPRWWERAIGSVAGFAGAVAPAFTGGMAGGKKQNTGMTL